jgi:hypothetical protein
VGAGKILDKGIGWWIWCTHVWKWKNETCWNYFKNEGGGVKENDGGGKSN